MTDDDGIVDRLRRSTQGFRLDADGERMAALIEMATGGEHAKVSFCANVAHSLLLQRKFDQAERLFQALLEADPSNTNYLAYLARALNEQDRSDEAEALLRRAARLDASNPTVSNAVEELASTPPRRSSSAPPRPEDED